MGAWVSGPNRKAHERKDCDGAGSECGFRPASAETSRSEAS